MSRREFTPMVYAEIVRRATDERLGVVCEGCSLVLSGKPYHVDHTIPDALLLDKKRKLTAADGKLLGVECCHTPKTKDDVSNIARAKRRERKHRNHERRKSSLCHPDFKRRMDGVVVNRHTGERV